MKRELDMNKVIRDATRKNISPYILIKRELNYRVPNKKDKLRDNCCGTCKFKHGVIFNGENRTQCHCIGISVIRHADIGIVNICDWYAKGYIRLKEKENV